MLDITFHLGRDSASAGAGGADMETCTSWVVDSLLAGADTVVYASTASMTTYTQSKCLYGLKEAYFGGGSMPFPGLMVGRHWTAVRVSISIQINSDGTGCKDYTK